MLKEIFEKYGRRFAVITFDSIFSCIDIYEIKFKNYNIIVERQSVYANLQNGCLTRVIPVIKPIEIVELEDIEFIFEYNIAIPLREDNILSSKLSELAYQVYLINKSYESVDVSSLDIAQSRVKKLYPEIIKLFPG